jgi:putative DNA primase/helicase
VIRFTANAPCPVCGGHERLPRGIGRRDAGFISDDGRWAHCERPEHAGDLPLDERTTPPTFLHLLDGPCRCGVQHWTGHSPVLAHETPRAEQGHRRIVATYEYRRAGQLLYRVARLKPKGFLPQHVNGTGNWEPGYGTDERILYRADDLTSAPGRVVFIGEGEKDADRLASVGLLATTNPGGSASWRKHAAAYAEHFRGRPRAVVLADNDDAGRKWSSEVAASLVGVGCPVAVLELPDLPAAGDVSDWLDAGHTVGELNVLATAAPVWTRPPEYAVPHNAEHSGAVRLSDVQPEAVEWLWDGRIARGKTTLVDGDPGQGKSVITLDWAARTSTGAAWPDGQPCRVQGPVLLLGAEDGLSDTVRPRLNAAAADVHRVYALPAIGEPGNERQPSIPDDLDAIEKVLVETGAVLLVVDPIMAYLDGKVNSHRDQDVRRALAPLVAMAERLRVAVVIVRHLNKGTGAPAIYRGGGSIGLAGAARIVLAVGADPNDETRRVLAPVKANLSEPAPSLAYRLVARPGEAVRVDWLGMSQVTAGQLLAAPADEDQRSALDDAKDFLHEQLANGPAAVKEVEQLAVKAGHTLRTLRRARDALNVLSSPSDFGGPRMLHLPTAAQSRPSNLSDERQQGMDNTGNRGQHCDGDGSGERVY